MANQTPLSAVLALFGSTCHYLEVTTKALVFFPSYIANSSPVLFVLLIINAILALGYLVIGWHLLGWAAWMLRKIGNGLERVHAWIGNIALGSLRNSAGLAMRGSRSLLRQLK